MFKKQLHLFHLGYPSIPSIIVKTSLSTSAINLKKPTKENVLKKFNKENKLLFGPLLETQAQRKKRLKIDGLLVASDINSTTKKLGGENRTSKYKLVVEEDGIVDDSKIIVENSMESPVQTIEIPVQYDQNALSLSEILKKDFPLENPAKSQIIDQSSFSNDLILKSERNSDISQNYYPSVTSILSATMSPLARRALERWRKNKIAALGMDGFLALNKATLQKGKDFHTAIQKVLTEGNERELDVPEDIRNCIKSAETILKQIVKVHKMEGEVVHSMLQYRGYVDCICDLGEYTNVAIEWKKSDSKKATIEQTYDAPLQLAAYMGAINYDDAYSFQVTSGVVVVVYEDASSASVFPVVPEHWAHWYRRYQTFRIQEAKEMLGQ